MRPINIMGLFCFILPLCIKYKSKRAIAIFINGLLYHYNDTNEYLKNYDILWNLFFTFYTLKSFPPTIKHTSIGGAFWILNNILIYNSFINNTIGDIIHVCGVQFPLSKGLELALKQKLILN
jgi:hypothetical protein